MKKYIPTNYHFKRQQTKGFNQKTQEMSYDVTYMWNLKYDRNEFIYEKETDSQS